jgi:3-hydroxyisobutyrate dehydrogenase
MTGTSGAGAKQAEKLGYLGLGMMGFPMSRRLLDAAHEVAIWNRSTGKAKALKAARGADADALEIYKISASQLR